MLNLKLYNNDKNKAVFKLTAKNSREMFDLIPLYTDELVNYDIKSINSIILDILEEITLTKAYKDFYNNNIIRVAVACKHEINRLRNDSICDSVDLEDDIYSLVNIELSKNEKLASYVLGKLPKAYNNAYLSTGYSIKIVCD